MWKLFYLNCVFVDFFCHFVLLLIKMPGIVFSLLFVFTVAYICGILYVCDACIWFMHSVMICNICIGILAGLANIL